MTDEQIIGRVRGGETRMFGELVRRYQDPVYGMALRFLGSASDAEDVAQEVFLRVFPGPGGVQGRCEVLHVAVPHHLQSLHRLAAQEPEAGPRDARPGRGGRLAGRRQGRPGRGPPGAEEQREAVRDALDALDEKYRSVVVLHYYQKLSYEQIAEVLDMPAEDRRDPAVQGAKDAPGEPGERRAGRRRMRCAHVGPLVERYVDGALIPARPRRIAAHAQSCARCTARIEAARTLQGDLAAGPARPAPRGFGPAVMDAVYREALRGGVRAEAGMARRRRAVRPPRSATAGSA